MTPDNILSIRELISDPGSYFINDYWWDGVQPSDDSSVVFLGYKGKIFRVSIQESNRETMEKESLEVRECSTEAGFKNW